MQYFVSWTASSFNYFSRFKVRDKAKDNSYVSIEIVILPYQVNQIYLYPQIFSGMKKFVPKKDLLII